MVRNFYVNAYIDGRKTNIGGGPARKDGGMRIRITQRNHGGIDEVVFISCYENGNGGLVTCVYVNGELVGVYETER